MTTALLLLATLTPASDYRVTNNTPAGYAVRSNLPPVAPAPRPAGKPCCVCGNGCTCPVGKCPNGCPVAAVVTWEPLPGGHVRLTYTPPGKSEAWRSFGGAPTREQVERFAADFGAAGPVTVARKPAPVAAARPTAAGYHTHTCARGHTWGHDGGPGSSHNCPTCGLYQDVVDAAPRPVVRYALPAAGGCAGGNCPLPRR